MIVYLIKLVSKKKDNYNIQNYKLVINQLRDFCFIFAKIYLFAKTFKSNLFIYSY